MKLHLGCGKKYLDGYKHIDLIKDTHIDFVCDISDMKEIIEDNSVEEIYVSHTLEHFFRKNIFDILLEWRRILKNDGILRIAVPDFNACIEYYKENGNLEDIIGLLYGGERNEYDFHRLIFDERILSIFLKETGFKDIKKYDTFSFLPNNFDDYSKAYLPHMDFKNGKLVSLNIQCIKDEKYIMKNPSNILYKFMRREKGSLRYLPEYLSENYTMNRKIPILYEYYDSSLKKKIIWEKEFIQLFINRFTRDNIYNKKYGDERFNGSALLFCQVFDKYDIKEKNIAIISSTIPWIEAICINYGASTINVINDIEINENDKIISISHENFNNSIKKYDIIITYSNVEHIGMGRWGEYLEPNGDIKEMSIIYDNLKNGGFCFCGIPVGKDCLVWNAHRIYGKIRLSYLIGNFNEIEWIGFDKNMLDTINLGEWRNQPILVLQKK